MSISKKRKPVAKKNCGPKSKCCKNDSFDGFLSDFVANKTTILILMIAVLGMGALFSLMLGVSAASF